MTKIKKNGHSNSNPHEHMQKKTTPFKPIPHETCYVQSIARDEADSRVVAW